MEHHIPLNLGARRIRQNKRRMNPQLQLLVRAELVKIVEGRVY